MFIKDVIKFVQNFAGVIDKSTPHLYLSALPFSPSNSVMANGLVKKFAGIAQVAVGQHHDWPRNEHVLQGHTAGVLSVAFSPDGRHIVSGSSDKTIRVWNVQTVVRQVGNSLQGYTSQPSVPVSLPLDKGHIVNSLQGNPGQVMSVAFSPDGMCIVSGSSDLKTIQVWNAQTGAQVGNPLHGHTDQVSSVAFSPDGRHIVSGSFDKTIRIWDAQTGGQMGNPLQGHTSQVMSVAFSPNGRQIVSGSSDNTIRVWDPQTGSQMGNSIQGHRDRVLSVAFSPNGRYIVSGSKDRTIRVWDTNTRGQVCYCSKHSDWVRSVAFSPNGRYIVSGSCDKTIRIWDAQTGHQVGNSLQGHTDWVRSIAFSPDGRYIVSGSSDLTIRVWDTQTGSQVGNPLQGHIHHVLSVAFSPDGRHIVSGSLDKTIQVWDAQRGSQFGDNQPSINFNSLVNFSSSKVHALQHAQSLFIDVFPHIRGDCRDLISLPNDGWIMGPNKELLLWVHPSYHPSFHYTPWTNLIIPKGYTELDLSRMRHGLTWHMCYSSDGMTS